MDPDPDDLAFIEFVVMPACVFLWLALAPFAWAEAKWEGMWRTR